LSNIKTTTYLETGLQAGVETVVVVGDEKKIKKVI